MKKVVHNKVLQRMWHDGHRTCKFCRSANEFTFEGPKALKIVGGEMKIFLICLILTFLGSLEGQVLKNQLITIWAGYRKYLWER